MYDMKNEPKEFVGSSRSEAVAEAVRFFGAEESELRVVELDGIEIHGMGARAAIVAVPKNARPPTSGGGGGGGGRDRDRGERGGGDRGGRGRGRERERGGRGGRDRDGDRGRKSRAPAGQSKGVAHGSLEEPGKLLLGIVERMKLGSFEISESSDDDFLVYELKGEAAETLGAGDGRTIDALQLLVNQAASREGDDAKRVVVDAEGNAERREVFLTRLAERGASRAVETKRSVALDPMNGRDRRILHVAIRDMDGVATMSIGEGRYRQVVVVPEGSPEYEDARKSSEAAAQRD